MVKRYVVRVYAVDVPADRVELVKDLIRYEGDHDEADEITIEGVARWLAHQWDAGDLTEYTNLHHESVVDDVEVDQELRDEDGDAIDDVPGDLSTEDVAFIRTVIDPDEARRLLDEVRAEPEVSCAHCDGVPDGSLTLKTETIDRDHRICDRCAITILAWL